MQSWIPAVLFVGFAAAFVRVRRGRGLLGLVKTSTAVGTVCYLLGWFQVFFAFPSHACRDHFDRLPEPVVLDRYESGFLPLRATCHWDDGGQKSLVGGWIDPLLLTCATVLVGCLVAMALLALRRRRKGTGVSGGPLKTRP